MNDIELIVREFGLDSTESSTFGNGHINDTYTVTRNGKKMILQRLNTKVFTRPAQVMQNIEKVTAHLKKKLMEAGADPTRETMTVAYTVDGKPCYFTDKGDCFRMYDYISDSYSIDKAENAGQMVSAAKAIGKFFRMLDDFPADSLHITIDDFHNTRKYYDKLIKAAEDDAAGRRQNVEEEIKFVKKHEGYADVLNNALENGEIPLRVTHNDTKLNNILFDQSTGEGMCVIDLDTVMPGSVLYDFGDAMRFGAASGPEDEKDLSKIWFDLDMFDAFTKGFAEEAGDTLNRREIELLADSVKILTFECGMRFLTDYLKGDVYFKIAYPSHNLDRARTQFKLVSDMESKDEQMKAIVKKYFK